jgi:chorismate synthase
LRSYRLGRVAAGAVAEKYLKEAHGIKIVAFVSSVGNVHLPSSVQPPSRVANLSDEDNDEAEDALSPEFRTLLATVTREEVDKFPTRCPHLETSDRMTKVCIDLHKDLSLKPPYTYLA